MAPPPTVNPTAVRLPSEVLTRSTAARAPAGLRKLGDGAAAPVEAVDTSAAIGELVEALKTTSIGLRFEIDETTHRVITKVIDKETGDLIRQMPTEEVLRIARAIDKLQGLFVSQAA
ncbi:Flagellar protein FlaG (plasmid) [Cupriavidus necator H850]|jgi:flagellar protein FlaG|uniref:flagellar protein FlaG n=1 Tax=Cupriavidus necator TaxID=106590 RepID=UPI00129EBB18|nr:flagellar protein FlaG [Cupriavidus necator]KAI3596060.1 Flagellar protein FlaG [Cupriavidus necator H850]